MRGEAAHEWGTRLFGELEEYGLAALDAHLRRDTAAPKMGHPILSPAMEAARM